MSEFENSRLLIDRAKKHIAEFKAVENAFGARKPYTMFREQNGRTGETLFKARINQKIPPGLGAIAFDIVGNLRSSLDHAVYDAVRIVTGIRAPKNTKFPFGKTRKNAFDNAGGRKSPIPYELRSLFLNRFKPYQRGDRALYALNEIRNQKIHRMLSPMALANQSVSFDHGYIGHLHVNHFKPKWNARKQELTYMTAKKADQIYMEISISIQIVINEPLFFKGKAALPIFDDLAGKVADIVDIIEAESLRIAAK